MLVSIDLSGEINKRRNVDISGNTTIKELINNYGGGMKNGARIKLVQLGGPLGICIRGEEINNRISDYYEDMYLKTIMVYGDKFCPIDFLRFLTRFLIRELRIDNHRVRELNEIIEDIANGRSTKRSLINIESIIDEPVLSRGEVQMNSVFKQIMTYFSDDIVEHVEARKCSSGICRGLIMAQCINACPAEVHIPGYVELMKSGRDMDAYRLMRKTNPLSLVCGKICSRPCEAKCRRGEIESTVGVRALQRYSSEMALDMGDFEEDKLEDNGKVISIIGSGPGGLSSAYYLARAGYDVTIYEAMDRLGGMLAYGIPEYRLPYNDLLREIRTIEDLGVEIVRNCRVGVDITLEELQDNSDAVIIATGAQLGNVMNLGFDGTTMSGVDYLRSVSLDENLDISGKVIVVGGGDVALDCARTSVRLGADEVSVISLEEYDDMPASLEEKDEAINEGIKFLSGYGLYDVNCDDGHILGLKKCTQVFDDDYNFRPQFDERDISTCRADIIIYAIGQRPDLSYLEEDYINHRGFIHIDSNFMTTNEGVFALGDATEVGVAIKAIAEGKKVASKVDEYLEGIGLYTGDEIEIPETPLNITLWDIAMVKECTVNPKHRQGFDEVTSTFKYSEAKVEASRCMRCDRNSVRQLLLKPSIV